MSKTKLYEKIVAVMINVGQLQKDGAIEDSNGKHMYNYLSEEVTTGRLQKAFIEYGLVLFPIKVESELIHLESMKYDKAVKTPITKVIVTYKICCAETGEFEELQSIGYGSDSQDKGSNKAMTSAFKYVQRQTFMISTGDDADHTPSHELDKQNEPAPPKTEQPKSAPPQNSAGANTGIKLATEGQSKMLYAKKKSTLFEGFERVNDFLGYDITNFNQVRFADVNKLIAFLDEHKFD